VLHDIGTRLKERRVAAGMSLREMAREADVSPSFLSQIENGKSQPSVATLFSFDNILGVKIDELFDDDATDSAAPDVALMEVGDGDEKDPARIWSNSAYTNRISLIHPSHRAQIAVAHGVQWERLAATPETSCNFMKLIYEPGSTSTEGGETIVHDGYEYGYILTGEFEVTIGSEVFVLRAGESIGFDCSIPHVFRNIGDVPVEGIWFIHGSHNNGATPHRSS
jgi:transcriptional regulator with XRE-family HTH domain